MKVEIWAEPAHGFPAHADDARRAQRLSATGGAPFIVVDGRYGVPGAQDSDALLGLLRTAWDESHAVTLAPGRGPDGCAVPARP